MDLMLLAIRWFYRLGPIGFVIVTLIGALNHPGEMRTAKDYLARAEYNQQNPAKYQSALQDYNQAIKLDPQSADAYAARGNFYLNWSKYLEKARTTSNSSNRQLARNFDFELPKAPQMRAAAIADYRQAKSLYHQQEKGYYALQLKRVITHVQRGEDYPFRLRGAG